MRFGRVPKREKAKILAAMQSVNARSQERAVLAELEDNTRVTAAIIRAHMDTCDFTRDKVAPMLQQARAHPSYTQCPPTLVSVLFSLFWVLARVLVVHGLGVMCCSDSFREWARHEQVRLELYS